MQDKWLIVFTNGKTEIMTHKMVKYFTDKFPSIVKSCGFIG